MFVMKVLSLVGHDAHEDGQYGSLLIKADKAGKSEDVALMMPYELLEELAVEALKARNSAFKDRRSVDATEPLIEAMYFITERFLSVGTTSKGHEITFRTNDEGRVTLRIPKGELSAVIEGLQKLHGRDHIPTILQ